MKRCLSTALPSRLNILGRDLLFVLCMNTVIAVSLNYGFQTGGTFAHNFLYSQLIGLSIWVFIDVPARADLVERPPAPLAVHVPGRGGRAAGRGAR